MLAAFFKYAANQVAGEAVEGIARRVVWGAVAGLLLVVSFVLAILIAYWLLEPAYGAIPVAASIAVACALLAFAALAIPAFGEWRKRRAADRSKTAATVSTASNSIAGSDTVAAVDADVLNAIDYFGALQVVGSAFMFGLGAARQLRR